MVSRRVSIELPLAG
ncbi:hypothetical protein EC960939_3679, partial [Escherichia coli 96.0939]